MRVIFVEGDDYAAEHFKSHFSGSTVEDIIETGETVVETDEYYFEITVLEVGEVSEEFINFVRNKLIDHDNGKHENFWLDSEVI